MALQITEYLGTLNWYLPTIGMIVSDFLFSLNSATGSPP